jgi:hypothetical protein
MEEKRLFLERIFYISPLPYYLEWSIFGAIIFLIAAIAIYYFDHSFSYLLPLFIISILIALQPTIVIWAYKKMKTLEEYLLMIIELPESEILGWYEDQISTVFDGKKMLATGVLYALTIHFLQVDQCGFTFQTTYPYYIIYAIVWVGNIFSGFGLYPLICTALMVHKISRLPMSINVLFSDNLKIKGLLYSKFTICAIVVYAIWGVFRLSTPNRLSSLSDISVFSFFALLLLAYFILPQYSIHQMMVKTKNEKQEMLSNQLLINAEEAFSLPTKDNVANLRAFLNIKHQLDERCAWPFGSYEILHIVLIVVVPFAVVLLEIVFKILK